MKTGRDRIDNLKFMLDSVKETGNKSFRVDFKVSQLEDIINDIEDDLDELDELRDVVDATPDYEDLVKIFKKRIELFNTFEEGIATYGFILGDNIYYLTEKEYNIMHNLFKVVK